MKQWIFILSFIFIGILLKAQNIHWVNPKPTGQIFNNIEFFNEISGLISQMDGKVFQTTDGGTQWELCFDNNGTSIRQIIVLSESCAWLLRNKREIIGTTDQGDSWFKLYKSPDSLEFERIKMVSETEAYATVSCINTESTYLGKSRDGGKNWTYKNLNKLLNDGSSIYDFAFTNLGQGIILTVETKRIYRTLDTCQTFEYHKYDDDETFYACTNSRQGDFFVVGSKILRNESELGLAAYEFINASEIDYLIRKSSDTGKTWQLSFYDESIPRLNFIKSLGDSTLYAYGRCIDNHSDEGCRTLPLISSTDCGISWEISHTSYDFHDKGYYYPWVRAIGIKSKTEALVSLSGTSVSNYYPGTSSILMQTQNAEEWRTLPGNFIEKINSLVFFDEKRVFSSEDVLIGSDHLGNKIDTLLFNENKYLGIADQIDDKNVCWARGRNSLGALITNDGGKSFISADTNTLFHIKDISCPTPEEAYFFQYDMDNGFKASLYKLIVSESRFSEINIPNNPNGLLCMIFKEDAGYLFGKFNDEGGFYKTLDDGENWVFYGLGFDDPIRSATEINDSLVVIEAGHFDPLAWAWQTEFWSLNLNTGLLEENLYSGIELGLVIDFLVNNENAYFALSSNGLFKSFGDNSWEQMGILPDLKGLTLDPDGYHVWAYGYSGRLLYIGDGLPVFMETNAIQEPDWFHVSYKPSTKNIEILIKNSSYYGEYICQISDLNGRILLHKSIYLQDKSFQFSINTQKICLGMYLFSIHTKNQVFTKKVVISE